ncbi:hypothetical protein HJC23_000466 [Cyclotella cryptica]|uniref:Uncharacterized protein n=1 Tax=Cyclotella cryptica TaxID=29204 RepID=A0ABD3QAL7_9STRA|eukprot:CCRYP_007219-RA/>CCRYP_007219-RA protein AED:0.00 eAED:0.00 QI:196/-1/1/1/-1/1/1/176/278
MSYQQRFQLLSSLPGSTANLKQFESEALKRQAEHSSRISDLEGRLALFHARLARESSQRETDHAATMEECINGPLEGVMRRALAKLEGEFVKTFLDPARADGLTQSHEDVGDKEEKKDSPESSTLHNLVTMERRINLLEAQMNHHRHITLFHSQRRNFDSVGQQFRSMLQPALALEVTKADKREGALVRRFETSAGEYARLLAEMQASRAASLGVVQKEIDSWKGIDASRAEHFLGEIRKLKDLVKKATKEREEHDEILTNQVEREMERLKAEVLSLA